MQHLEYLHLDVPSGYMPSLSGFACLQELSLSYNYVLWADVVNCLVHCVQPSRPVSLSRVYIVGHKEDHMDACMTVLRGYIPGLIQDVFGERFEGTSVEGRERAKEAYGQTPTWRITCLL
jgi:hypothetical protein